MSITFMAKPNEREGNSCHIHLSLRGADGTPVLAGTGRTGCPALGEHFLAGQLAALRELTLLLRAEHQLLQAVRCRQLRAHRGRAGASTTGPARCGWSGTAHSLRVENRVPGGDVNPYLAVAAMIAAGLHGIDNELPLEPACVGNAYDGDSAAGAGHAARRAGASGRAARSPRRRSASEVVDALRQLRPRRARRLRRRRHRLGAAPRLRTAVTRDAP